MDKFLELDVNYLYVSVNPDPAGQFANPYSYGGDPVNYVDPNGEFATFGFHSGGFSLGANLTPIGAPVGAGINVGRENGGYVGFYGEVGPRVGCSGATVETGYNYYFHHGSQVYTSAGFQNGPWRAGVSNSYNFQSEQWSGVTLNASVAIPGTNFGVGGSYNLKTRDLNGTIAYYGSNGNWDYHAGIGFGDNGFSWNLGGQYVNRTIHPSGLMQAGIDDAIAKQLKDLNLKVEYLLFDKQTSAQKIKKEDGEKTFSISIPKWVKIIAHTHGLQHSDWPTNVDGISASDPKLKGLMFAVINVRNQTVIMYDGRDNWFGPNALAAGQNPPKPLAIYSAKPTNYDIIKLKLGLDW